MLSHTKNGDSYTLISPFNLTVATYDTNTNNQIEVLTPVNTSTGIYYVDLNNALYDSNVIYNLQWDVKYVSAAPVKILQNLFKYDVNSPNNLYTFGEINYELENSSDITYEIQEQQEIIVEIINSQ